MANEDEIRNFFAEVRPRDSFGIAAQEVSTKLASAQTHAQFLLSKHLADSKARHPDVDFEAYVEAVGDGSGAPQAEPVTLAVRKKGEKDVLYRLEYREEAQGGTYHVVRNAAGTEIAVQQDLFKAIEEITSRLLAIEDLALLTRREVEKAEARFGPMGFDIRTENADPRTTDTAQVDPVVMTVSREQKLLYRVEFNRSAEYVFKNSGGCGIVSLKHRDNALNKMISLLADHVPANQYARAVARIQDGRVMKTDSQPQ